MPNLNSRKNRTRSRYLVLCVIAICLRALLGELSNAQSPSQAAPADSASSMSGLEDITVTARREKETILDVPQSITGFSEKTLENMHIESFQDYATKVPKFPSPTGPEA